MSWTRLSSASSRTLGRLLGGRITLIKVERVRDDDALETTFEETPYPVQARITRGAVRDQATGLLVRSDHRTVLIAASDLPRDVEPAKTDKLSIDGAVVSVLSVERREPAGEPTLYRLEVSN